MAKRVRAPQLGGVKKISSQRPSVSGRRTKKSSAAPPCDAPGHCPPVPAAAMKEAMPPRVSHGLPSAKRPVPPAAERRAFEDAVNGWWWL